MEFNIERKVNENIHKYPTDDFRIAEKFSSDLKKELGDFLMGAILFGSSARAATTKNSDIDVLVITDDTQFVITEVLIEGYRLIVEKLIHKHSLKLHITSMTFTVFWENIKNGDPVSVNILRDGVALTDIGFFEPLQLLLKQGKVRPSEESVWRYFGRAPKTLLNSRWHVLQATLDLYWAVIDSAHAALMRANQVPPTPDHVADLLEKIFVARKQLEPKFVEIMRDFYDLNKKITHRQIQEISGPEYEKLYARADLFVRRMKVIIERGRF